MTWTGRWTKPGANVNGGRSLGAAYTPSATAYVQHFVSIQMVITAGQSVQVSALCDGATLPATERARVSNNIVGTVTAMLTWISAPGDNCKLVATGTGAATIAAQWEVPLGAPSE